MSYKPLLDQGQNVGNSPGPDARGRIHTKISNADDEPIPVNVTASIAPSGLATEDTLLDVLASTQSIDGKLDVADIDLGAITGLISDTNAILTSISGEIDVQLSTRASEATSAAILARTIIIDGHIVETNAVLANISGHVASIDSDIDVALSTRASSSNQDLEISLLQNITGHQASIDTHVAAIDADIDVALSTRASEATLSALNIKVPSGLTVTSSRLLVDNSGGTQPVSGTVVVTQPTGTNLHSVIDSGDVRVTQNSAWNINSITGTIVLPTGAATSLLQVTGNTSLSSLDTKVPSGLTVTSNRLVVDGSQVALTIGSITGSITLPTGASTAANQATIIANQTNGTQQVKAVSFPTDVTTATQNITTQDIGSSTTTGANGQVIVLGNPTAGSVASFSPGSIESIEIQVSGVWTGTIQLEVSMDGGTIWYTRGVKQTGSPYIASSFTQPFAGGLNLAAMTGFRARATAAMTGTAIVRILPSLNTSNVIVTNPLMLRDATTQTIFSAIKAASTAALATDPALVVAVSPNNTPVLPSGAATSALQTTGNTSTASVVTNQTNGTQKTQVVDGSGNVSPAADTAARSQFQRITDGTNTATVKAASTAAVASDTALVVAISPNSAGAIVSTKTDLTPAAPTAVSVGITSASAVSANANRKGLSIVNTSINRVSLGFGQTAVLNSGVTLFPGGVFTMDEYSFDTAVVNAIASVASSNISIQEYS